MNLLDLLNPFLGREIRDLERPFEPGKGPRRKGKKGNLHKTKNWKAKRKAKIRAQKLVRRINRAN